MFQIQEMRRLSLLIEGYVLRGIETQEINSPRQFAVTTPVSQCLRMEERSIETKTEKVKEKP